MKLEGYRRLEAHVPTDLWDEIEKARGQMTRSEFTRQALRAQLDYPSMLAAPPGSGWKPEAKGVVTVGSTVPPAKNGTVAKTEKAAYSSESVPTAAKSAREILAARTRLMRGNNSGS